MGWLAPRRRDSPELAAIDRYAFGGFSLSAYFLRVAGVAVWRAGQWMWADSRLCRDGEPLRDDELGSMRVSASDSMADPRDRLCFGEPQFLAYRDLSVDLLVLMSRHSACSARIPLGFIDYDMVVQPPNARPQELSLVEPRHPIAAAQTGSNLTSLRPVKVGARFLAGD